jgi:hypothetical protein
VDRQETSKGDLKRPDLALFRGFFDDGFGDEDGAVLSDDINEQQSKEEDNGFLPDANSIFEEEDGDEDGNSKSAGQLFATALIHLRGGSKLRRESPETPSQ